MNDIFDPFIGIYFKYIPTQLWDTRMRKVRKLEQCNNKTNMKKHRDYTYFVIITTNIKKIINIFFFFCSCCTINNLAQ